MNINANAADINVQGKTAQVFQFKQLHEIRIHVIEGEPWFALRDVCDTLDLKVASPERFQLDSKGVTKLVTPTASGDQELTFVNEPNLYRVIFRSNKPEAKQFQDWVFNDVLPSIRKHGMFLDAAAMRPSMTNEHWQEIYRKVDGLCSSWALGKDSKNWIFNHMRVVFSVPRFDDIPDDQFHTVMQLLAAKEEARYQFVTFVNEARHWFEKEVLGGGQPWTPTIKAKLTRQLQRQIILPPKTDWLALAKMVDQKAEGSAAA
ncbi:MAG: hypothetical protein KJ989_12985 [Gammaproteobacteria bacterium]|uniref:Bro-N domain-containing protein n=1 Tax=viral metagenome TaxID=1070528 RepID=A0A6H2A2L9_9ZZZZ|nr:hypothetical protein [Gammaproteobacteria bacterium]MBU2157130.1 hypothetical protein [Gammaproteobacteria bacterium]MBU2256044.1 hypothetical protein [Gammaproteobacteria bacterium]MBU2295112.1 hypothetical protein [Gammaproteobacteria bacterium]